MRRAWLLLVLLLAAVLLTACTEKKPEMISSEPTGPAIGSSSEREPKVATVETTVLQTLGEEPETIDTLAQSPETTELKTIPAENTEEPGENTSEPMVTTAEPLFDTDTEESGLEVSDEVVVEVSGEIHFGGN